MPAVVPIITIATAVVGAAVSGYSAIQQQQAGKKQAQVQEQIIAEQRRAEELRKQQMELDAARRRREIVRKQIAARAVAQATATAQGAGQAGSSALPGAYGGISSKTNTDILGVDQNEEIGGKLFDINGNISNLYRQSAQYQSNEATYKGLFSLGGAMVNSAETIGKVGGYFVPSKSSSPMSLNYEDYA